MVEIAVKKTGAIPYPAFVCFLSTSFIFIKFDICKSAYFFWNEEQLRLIIYICFWYLP